MATFFPKDLAYRFSTLLVVAGCYLFMRFVITDANIKYILNYIYSNCSFYKYLIIFRYNYVICKNKASLLNCQQRGFLICFYLN